MGVMCVQARIFVQKDDMKCDVTFSYPNNASVLPRNLFLQYSKKFFTEVYKVRNKGDQCKLFLKRYFTQAQPAIEFQQEREYNASGMCEAHYRAQEGDHDGWVEKGYQMLHYATEDGSAYTMHVSLCDRYYTRARRIKRMIADHLRSINRKNRSKRAYSPQETTPNLRVEVYYRSGPEKEFQAYGAKTLTFRVQEWLKGNWNSQHPVMKAVNLLLDSDGNLPRMINMSRNRLADAWGHGRLLQSEDGAEVLLTPMTVVFVDIYKKEEGAERYSWRGYSRVHLGVWGYDFALKNWLREYHNGTHGAAVELNRISTEGVAGRIPGVPRGGRGFLVQEGNVKYRLIPQEAYWPVKDVIRMDTEKEVGKKAGARMQNLVSERLKGDDPVAVVEGKNLSTSLLLDSFHASRDPLRSQFYTHSTRRGRLDCTDCSDLI